MTNKSIRYIALLFVACLTLTFAATAFAQVSDTVDVIVTTPPPNPEIAKAVENFLPGFLSGLVEKYPWLATVIVFMGAMRIWAKPVITGIQAIVRMTSTTADDTWWDRFTTFLQSPAGAWLHWLLDYTCSIKLVKPEPKEEQKSVV